jgi:hypothetical protein
MRRTAAIIGRLALIAGLPLPAMAAGGSGSTALQTQVFGHPLGTEKAHACFQRAYDEAHLKSHPQQNVRTMTLLVTGDASDPNAPGYSVGLDVRFRKVDTHFQTYGSCWSVEGENGESASSIGCGIDCDGGQIDVKLKDDKSLLVGIPDGARMWEANSEADAESTSDTEEEPGGRGQFGADDKLFRLDRTALTDCLPLAMDDEEKAALQRGQ